MAISLKKALSLALSIELVLAFSYTPGWLCGISEAQSIQFSPIQLNKNDSDAITDGLRDRLQNKELTLEDLFPKIDIGALTLPPVPLSGVKIPGLTDKSTMALGQSYVISVENTSFSTMADAYRDIRLSGKSCYVTPDCVVNPYMTTVNGILASAVEEHVSSQLLALLSSMLRVSANDFKNAGDSEVRDDLKRNVAFLLVGMKLLDPALNIPRIGDATVMAESEVSNIYRGTKAKSAINGTDEDFGCYQPIGWWNASNKLKNFYRCRQWLSRTSFPLTDSGNKTTGVNSFRRSILLFRSLDLATIHGEPAYDTWNKLSAFWQLIGTSIDGPEGKNLLPPDYKSVLKDTTEDLKVTLNNLALPFYRTKLLLTVRRQSPVELRSTSIFDLVGEKKEKKVTTAVFRLMPHLEEPEIDWLKKEAHDFEEQPLDQGTAVLGLLELHCRGSVQATNILADHIGGVDPQLTEKLPPLEAQLGLKAIRKQQETYDPVWQILCCYFRALPETMPQVYHTKAYITKGVESALGGWLDKHINIAMIPADSTSAAATTKAVATSTPAQSISQKPQTSEPAAHDASASIRRMSEAIRSKNAAATQLFQYLDPNPDIFRRMSSNISAIESDLNNLGYFPEQYHERCKAIAHLCDQLAKIAAVELKHDELSPEDASLLANIDIALQPISVPTAGSLFLDTNDTKPPGPPKPSGVTLGLGRPAMFYMILQTGAGAMLCRGATYSCFELPGGPFSLQQWDRKLEYGMLRPLFWTQPFDIVQEIQFKTNAAPAQNSNKSQKQVTLPHY